MSGARLATTPAYKLTGVQHLLVSDSGIGVMMAPLTLQTVPVMRTQPQERTVSPQGASEDVQAESSFELLLRAKRGDSHALDRLCASYLPRLRKWAHGRLPASARALLDTEDLAQDVLFQAVSKVDTFEPRHEGAFQGFVRQIDRKSVV